MKVLEVNELSKKYISRKGVITLALNSVSFDVKTNEMVAIMGSSGSGKTTLINILSGILKSDQGEVLINGKDIQNMSKDDAALFRRKNVGIVFQNYNLLDSLTVEENIKVPLIFEKTENMEDRVREITQILGIEHLMDKYPYEISGGQQQRVGIGRAIVNKASIIFADEPTGNLDSKSTKRVMDYFVNTCKECQASLLLVTHDLLTASYCDRIIYLQDGQIVAEIGRKDNQDEFFEIILKTQKEYI